MNPSARPSLLAGAALALLLVLATTPAARAGEDDFEYGQTLAEARYFDYARRVYEKMLADAAQSDDQKNKARYGLASLPQEEARAASVKKGSAYAEVKQLFSEAARQVGEFAEKFPTHAKADDARLATGTTRLAFVFWARDLLNDKSWGEHGTTEVDVTKDAKQFVDEASATFDKLQVGHDDLGTPQAPKTPRD